MQEIYLNKIGSKTRDEWETYRCEGFPSQMNEIDKETKIWGIRVSVWERKSEEQWLVWAPSQLRFSNGWHRRVVRPRSGRTSAYTLWDFSNFRSVASRAAVRARSTSKVWSYECSLNTLRPFQFASPFLEPSSSSRRTGVWYRQSPIVPNPVMI
jgi:hypothetical protein